MAGCSRCNANRRRENLDAEALGDLSQCRSCGTWWFEPMLSTRRVIGTDEAQRLLDSFGPKLDDERRRSWDLG